MDSGSTIGPLDHKTTISFHVGNPMNTYEIQEGMTGYIYATNSVIKNMFPDLAKERALNTMWLNFIQVIPDFNPSKRFKRLPLFKTTYQLDEYRLRQVSTFKRIVELLVEDRTPIWSTDRCNNFFHSPCIFHPVHRQGSESSMLSVLNNDFVQLAAWNPERVEK
jgi:hypothetical protein